MTPLSTTHLEQLDSLENTVMSHTNVTQELAIQLGLQHLYELLPEKFHAAIKSAVALSVSQPQPRDPYQEPAHICRFDNLVHPRENS